MQSIKNHIIIIIVTSLITSGGTWATFYFNTKYTLEEHTNQLIKDDVRITNIETSINDIKSDIAEAKLSVAYAKTDVGDIKQSQNQTQADIKEIYRLLLGQKSK